MDLDARSLRPGAESEAHATDRAPDRARAGPRYVGGRADKLLVADESIRVTYEGRQDDELEVGEMDGLAANPGLMGRQVQSEIAGDEDVIGGVR